MKGAGRCLSCFIWNAARLSADLSTLGRHAEESTVSTTDGGGTRSMRSYAFSNAACSSEKPASSTVPKAGGGTSETVDPCVSRRRCDSRETTAERDAGAMDSTVWWGAWMSWAGAKDAGPRGATLDPGELTSIVVGRWACRLGNVRGDFELSGMSAMLPLNAVLGLESIMRWNPSNVLWLALIDISARASVTYF